MHFSSGHAVDAKSISEATAAEYRTLRDEILQLYREQAQLCFVSSLSVLAGLAIKSGTDLTSRLGLVSASYFLLSGLTWRISANYYKIFCLGTYMSYVHECKGIDPADYRPGPLRAGWHTRWRKIDASARQRVLNGKLGQTPTHADAAFLSSVAIAVLILALGDVIGQLAPAISAIRFNHPGGTAVATGIAVVSATVLAWMLRRLVGVQSEVAKFAVELRRLIKEQQI